MTHKRPFASVFPAFHELWNLVDFDSSEILEQDQVLLVGLLVGNARHFQKIQLNPSLPLSLPFSPLQKVLVVGLRG